MTHSLPSGYPSCIAYDCQPPRTSKRFVTYWILSLILQIPPATQLCS